MRNNSTTANELHRTQKHFIVSESNSFAECDPKPYFLFSLISKSGNLHNDHLLYVIVDEMPKNYTMIIELSG
jgi:hypothetical protein